MKLKNGVKLDGTRPEIWMAVGVLEGIYASLGKELVVTSLNDGTHMVGSRHYQGLAADIRIRDLSPMELEVVLATAKLRLEPAGYDVVDERKKAHIHVEYDPKGQELWFRWTD